MQQRRPFGGTALPPIEDEPELPGTEVLLERVHHREAGQPVVDLRLTAAREDGLNDTQPLSQSLGLGDLLVQCLELSRQDGAQTDGAAIEQLRHVRQRQAHAAQGLDAVQARDIVAAVQPIAAVGSPRRAQQPDFVVVVQRANRETGAPGQFADFEDAVLAESAHSAGAQAIITRNGRDFQGGPLRVYSPLEWLAI